MFDRKEYMREYQREYMRRYREKNPEYGKKYDREHRIEKNKITKQWQKDNKEYLKQYRKQWRINNQEKIKLYRENNRKKIKEYMRQYQKDNYERIKIQKIKYQRQWRKKNPDKVIAIRKKYRKWCNDWERNKRRINLNFNLNHRMRVVIGQSLKGNKAGRKWEDLVGYTLSDLIKRLKRTMPKGYTWQDYLDGKLHIDHIIPKSVFNFTKPEHIDFKRCWALSNLRLLPVKENLIKGSKLMRPFQLALRI